VTGYADSPPLDRQKGCQDVDHSALACAVGPEEGEDLALPDEEADAVNGFEVAVFVFEILDLYYSLAHLQAAFSIYENLRMADLAGRGDKSLNLFACQDGALSKWV